MQAAPSRYVSVSELYSTDEVELLLDEIRELEPTSCRGEDVQDFEIAGSGAGGGGLSPAGTELTERSWDSHAQYGRAARPGAAARALAPVYWRCGRGAAPGALLTLLCAAACGALWAGAGLRVARLPLASRPQLLLLAALSSALLHATLLVMHVTRLANLLPIDWNLLGCVTCVWSALSLSVGGGLTVHAVLCAPQYAAWGGAVRGPLACAGVLALCGGALALCMAGGAVRTRLGHAHHYRAVPPPPPPPPL